MRSIPIGDERIPRSEIAARGYPVQVTSVQTRARVTGYWEIAFCSSRAAVSPVSIYFCIVIIKPYVLCVVGGEGRELGLGWLHTSAQDHITETRKCRVQTLQPPSFSCIASTHPMTRPSIARLACACPERGQPLSFYGPLQEPPRSCQFWTPLP